MMISQSVFTLSFLSSLGAASYGWDYFKYCVINPVLGHISIIPVKPIKPT